MAVVTGEPRLFRSAKAILGESPVWDPAGDLLWCDIEGGTLHRSPLDGSVFGADDGVGNLGSPVPSFHPASGGGFVVSLKNRVILIDETARETLELATLSHAHDGMRLNEGKVDPFGRWVTGSMDAESDSPAGIIYAIDTDGATTVLREGLSIPNGFEWTRDGSKMYFSDTALETVFVGDYSLEGGLTNVEVFHEGESHDGMTMDAEGYLWGACYGAAKVVRYKPSGRQDHVINLPAPNITSVAFGGAEMSTLFVTSARENLSDAQLREFPMSGVLFSIDTSTTGYLPRRFGEVTATPTSESTSPTAGAQS
ncbi:MAG TPA: SMP-30/gluconolactonase/LRE family protein [Glaciihabitans sp.]|jgi:sugar lactone lactonase YvrE|nr:SMP-30/gluconolactonase/LRE family protein [Glaciihabitans sp.]